MRWIFLLFFSLTTLSTFAQTARAYEKAGDEAYAEKDFYAAMQHYSTAYEINENQAQVLWKLAETARKFYAFSEAEKYYEQLARKSGSAFPLNLYYLAEVEQTQGKYKEAKKHYKRFLRRQKGVSEYFKLKAERGMAACDWAMEQSKPEKKAEAAKNKVNTDWSELAPYPMGDTLVFSTLRYSSSSDDNALAKTMLQAGEKRPKVLLKEKGKHIATAVQGNSANEWFCSLCESLNERDLRCDLYRIEMDGRRRKKMEALSVLNIKGSNQAQPHFAVFDGKPTLFFVSDRVGGAGGSDLYYAHQKENGDFERPVAITALNSPDDELSPYFDIETQTLFYGSTWEQGFGGWDVVYSNFRDGDWQKAENAGQPINSSYHDFYFKIDAATDKAVWSSNRPGSGSLIEEESTCCYDIYYLEDLDKAQFEKEELLAQVDSGKVEGPIITQLFPKEGSENEPIDKIDTPSKKPQKEVIRTKEPDGKTIIKTEFHPSQIPNNAIPPTNNKAESDTVSTSERNLSPVVLYFDNDEPNPNTSQNFSTKNYEESYNAYIARRAVFSQNYRINMQTNSSPPLSVDAFFDDFVMKGFRQLQKVNQDLLATLRAGKRVKLQVLGYTSPRAQSRYNDHLASRRIHSVIKHFSEYEEGIFAPFLRSGQLQFSSRIVGERSAPIGISDNLNNETLSIYSPEASKERRVELQVIVMN